MRRRAAIRPPPFVAADIRRRRLLRLPGREAETGDVYWLMLPPGRCPPAVAAFRDWLLAEAAR
jgi:DNA-binding transcriptional LysR family regulator